MYYVFLKESANTFIEEVPPGPPILEEQLDTAIGMLLNAIKKNHTWNRASPFTSCLLVMTLTFLIRLIKGQAFREETAAVVEEKGTEEVEGEGVEQGEQLIRKDRGMYMSLYDYAAAVCT